MRSVLVGLFVAALAVLTGHHGSRQPLIIAALTATPTPSPKPTPVGGIVDIAFRPVTGLDGKAKAEADLAKHNWHLRSSKVNADIYNSELPLYSGVKFSGPHLGTLLGTNDAQEFVRATGVMTESSTANTTVTDLMLIRLPGTGSTPTQFCWYFAAGQTFYTSYATSNATIIVGYDGAVAIITQTPNCA